VAAVDPPNGRHLERHLPIGSDVIPATRQLPSPSPSPIISATLVTLVHPNSVHNAASGQLCNDPAGVAVMKKFSGRQPDP
jgi:hypothetical protein